MVSEYSHHLWLRTEFQDGERRTPLTPDACKTLLSSQPKWKVTVESSADRIFEIDEYEAVGCEIVGAGAWLQDAPPDAYIIGIEKWSEFRMPLVHTHICYGHCYKDQYGGEDKLLSFCQSGGALLDYEYMCNDQGKRAVDVFEPIAGLVGAALGLDVWAHQSLNPSTKYPAVVPCESSEKLIANVWTNVDKVLSNNGLEKSDETRYPKVIIIGAFGRCGNGASDALERIGLPKSHITKWGSKETAKPGPISELLHFDIVINCISIDPTVAIPPLFLNKELLSGAGKERKLSLIVDISCDVLNPRNPLRVVTDFTTFESPTIRLLDEEGEVPLDIIAINNLASLLAKESSVAFSEKLLPIIQDLPNLKSNEFLKNAKMEFDQHIDLLQDKYLQKKKRRRCEIS